MLADVLTVHGIIRSPDVIRIADIVGLELAQACAMLVRESNGGHNVWGHDAVSTGGIYVKGGEVTRTAYLNYKARRNVLGAQGVGPTQLTWPPYQDQADTLGGCWDWASNVRVGFGILAGFIDKYGEHSGFRVYNAGESVLRQAKSTVGIQYANDSVALAGIWRGRILAALSPTPAILRVGDTGPAVQKLQTWLNRMFPAYSHIDLSPMRYGPQTTAVIREFQRRVGLTGKDGTVVDHDTWTHIFRLGYST